MSEDRFFEKLREEARPLRYEADDFVTTRVAARVRERITTQPSVAGVLARWFRPLAASMAAAALAATIGIVWMDRATTPTAAESLASSNAPVEIAIAGDVYSVNP